MAIKGKGRTKARGVARAPRAAYTPPPVPWYSRRWVQVTAAFLAGIMAVALFAWVRGNLRRADLDRERRRQQSQMRTVMRDYQGRMDPILTEVGQAQPPIFRAFPRLGETIDAYKNGDASEAEVRQTASSTARTAGNVYDAMTEIDTASLFRGRGRLPAGFTRDVIASKSQLSHAVKEYEESSVILGLAVDARGSEHADLLKAADELQNSADTLFADGYNAYYQAQTAAGTFQPPQPGLPGGAIPGLPGGGVQVPPTG